VGFKCSWVAFQNTPKYQILDVIGGIDTGEEMEIPFETELCIAELPDNWILICAEDFMYAAPDVSFPDEGNMARLSAKGRVLGCMFHEGIMFSAASMYEFGKELWCVMYNSEEESQPIMVTKNMPDNFPAVYERLRAEQEKADRQGDDVAYLFDVPIEVASGLCGYRHDYFEFAWGKPKFTRVELK